MEKSCRKCAPQARPKPVFNFGKYPKTAIACDKFFLKKDILKEDNQKALKKLTLFFISNPVPFNEQNYQKQEGPRISDQLLFKL